MAARLSVQSLWFIKITGTQRALHPLYARSLPFRGSCNSAVLSKAAVGIISPVLKTMDLRIKGWPVIAAVCSLSAIPKENNFSLEHIKIERQNAIQRTRNVSPGSAQLPFLSGCTLSLAIVFISLLGSQTTKVVVLLQREVNYLHNWQLKRCDSKKYLKQTLHCSFKLFAGQTGR